MLAFAWVRETEIVLTWYQYLERDELQKGDTWRLSLHVRNDTSHELNSIKSFSWSPMAVPPVPPPT